MTHTTNEAENRFALLSDFTAANFKMSAGGSLSDSDSDDGQFNLRLPPLCKALQKILQRYPDGQIFKVSSLSQN